MTSHFQNWTLTDVCAFLHLILIVSPSPHIPSSSQLEKAEMTRPIDSGGFFQIRIPSILFAIRVSTQPCPPLGRVVLS